MEVKVGNEKWEIRWIDEFGKERAFIYFDVHDVAEFERELREKSLRYNTTYYAKNEMGRWIEWRS